MDGYFSGSILKSILTLSLSDPVFHATCALYVLFALAALIEFWIKRDLDRRAAVALALGTGISRREIRRTPAKWRKEESVSPYTD